jgi:hypothetical protein
VEGVDGDLDGDDRQESPADAVDAVEDRVDADAPNHHHEQGDADDEQNQLEAPHEQPVARREASAYTAVGVIVELGDHPAVRPLAPKLTPQGRRHMTDAP